MENDSNREIERLRLRISALEQLLAAYEQTVLEQATRIESAMQRASDQAEALHAIVAGTAVAIGKDFFHSLVSHLASVLKDRRAEGSGDRTDSHACRLGRQGLCGEL